MRIAVFDYKIIATNPIGSCHLRMLQGLCQEHDFVVFAAQFDNPAPDRIRFVRVPVPTRPLALLFVLYHLVAPFVYWLYRLRTAQHFELIQSVECNCLLRSDIVYSHFCHKRFLKVHWPAVRNGGAHGVLRWLDHFLHRLAEPIVYRRAGRIVVPSRGLSRELLSEFPCTESRVQVLANPVDLERMRRPTEFDRAAKRQALGFADDDTVLVFVALGHFQRKGLPLILEAMSSGLPAGVKLLVVGGEPNLTETYRRTATEMGISDRVIFTGMQRDVREFFWSADAFILPSIYEVFPLVALEAAAAGLPMLVSPLNGVEEFLVDGLNGFLIERHADGVRRGAKRLLGLSRDERLVMGTRAQADVRQYSIPQFQSRWRDVYDHDGAARQNASATASLNL